MNANRYTASFLFTKNPVPLTGSDLTSQADIHISADTPQNLREDGSYFVLSVPVDGMQDLVLEVGGISGRVCPEGKIQHLGIKTCSPGFDPSESPSLASEPSTIQSAASINSPKKSNNQSQRTKIPSNLIAVQGTAAHLICQILSTRMDFGHVIAIAQILEVYTDPEYWDGKTFSPKTLSKSPFLTFLGSKRFGTVVPCDN